MADRLRCLRITEQEHLAFLKCKTHKKSRLQSDYFIQMRHYRLQLTLNPHHVTTTECEKLTFAKHKPCDKWTVAS